jgi:hypothetical protein
MGSAHGDISPLRRHGDGIVRWRLKNSGTLSDTSRTSSHRGREQ